MGLSRTTLTVVLCLIGGDAVAHLGGTLGIPAVGELVEVDGDLSDWKSVSTEPVFTEQDFSRTIVNGDTASGLIDVDPSDLRMSIWLGWRESAICGFVRRWDDVNIDELTPEFADGPRYLNYAYDNDSFSMFIDADHSGGLNERFDRGSEELPVSTFQMYNFIVGRTGPRAVDVNEDWLFDWPTMAPWIDHAAEIDVGEKGGVSDLEFCISGWDVLDSQKGPGASTLHRFVQGETIGLQIHAKDYDASGRRTEQEWDWLFLGDEMSSMGYTRGELLYDVLLEASPTTGVEGKSWGRIKNGIE